MRYTIMDPEPVNVAAPQRRIVAMGPYCWGLGSNSTEALQHAGDRMSLAQVAAATRIIALELWEVPLDGFVNAAGRLVSDDPRSHEFLGTAALLIHD